MRLLIILIALAFLVACSTPSTIEFKNGKPERASNYTITNPNGPYVPFIPDNWFTGTLKSLMDGLGPYMQAFSSAFGGKTVIPPITPAPEPAPAPAPAPAPVPPPAPVPVRPYP